MHLLFLVLKWEEQEKKNEENNPLVIKLLKETQIRKQIVQSADTEDTTIKDDAFLSDKTRFFDRPTRSRNTDIFNSLTSGGGDKAEKKVNLKELGAMVAIDPFQKAATDYAKKKKKPGTQGLGRSVSSSNDFLENIPSGDMTYLNTVEYKYYGFYHRIRQNLEQFWGRSIQEKAAELVKSGRTVASSEQFVTALIITLDEQGEILEIHLKATSGIKELDEAAIESFKEAGPFPNPPKELIVDGKVILEWGFVVKS